MPIGFRRPRTPCLMPTRRVGHFTAKLGDSAILGFPFCKCLAVAEARPTRRRRVRLLGPGYRASVTMRTPCSRTARCKTFRCNFQDPLMVATNDGDGVRAIATAVLNLALSSAHPHGRLFITCSKRALSIKSLVPLTSIVGARRRTRVASSNVWSNSVFPSNSNTRRPSHDQSVLDENRAKISTDSNRCFASVSYGLHGRLQSGRSISLCKVL